MWESIKKRTVLLNIFGALVLYFAFFWVGSSILQNYTKHNQTISVPDLRGLSYDRVKDILSNKGLELKIADSSYNPKKLAWTILEQNPAPNAKVKEGRTIYLTVNSRIAPQIKVPDLKDVSLKQAQMILESAGLNVGKLLYKPDLAQNAVLDQLYKGNHIDIGTSIRKGATIDLVLGDGLGKTDMDIPQCVGQTFGEAKFIIDGSSLNLGRVNFDATVHGDTLNATVYKQSPESDGVGTIKVGGTIDLYLTMDKSLLNK